MVEREPQTRRAYLEGRIVQRQTVLERIGQGEIQEGQSWENDLKLGQARQRFREKIAGFQAELDKLAIAQAKTYRELLGLREKQLRQLRRYQQNDFLSPETLKTREEELRGLENKLQEDPFLQKGLELLQRGKRGSRRPRAETQEFDQKVKTLRKEEPLGNSEIAKRLGVKKEKVERAVRRLIQAGEIKGRRTRKPRGQIITLIEDLFSQHPERRVTLKEIGPKLGVTTREGARQILAKAQKEDPQLRIEKWGERINLYQLARMVDAPPKRLINLLKQGEISLGHKALDQLAVLPHNNRYRKKFILPQNLNLDKIREAASNPDPAALILPLTLHRARTKPDFYPTLTSLTKQAGLKTSRNIPFIAETLTKAGFFVAKLPAAQGRKLYYYFTIADQREKIITYLKANRPLKPRRPRAETQEFDQKVKTLRKEEPLGNSEIAKRLGVKKRKVETAVSRLIRAGEIERQGKQKSRF